MIWRDKKPENKVESRETLKQGGEDFESKGNDEVDARYGVLVKTSDHSLN